MFAEVCLFAALQVGPFFEKRADYTAVRPFYAHEEKSTDVLWPLFTSHDDWWRALLFIHSMENKRDGSSQFSVFPFYMHGRTRAGERYAWVFPFYGNHPHILTMDEISFCMWPLWHRYTMPRKSAPGGKVTANSVLFPFISWADDGSWSVWPIYGVRQRRESTHRFALWPFVTWADYRADRDTSGKGYSWMVWPFYASLERERETQSMVLPPFFSITQIQSESGAFRIRCPWPFIDIEKMPQRSRISLWPLYESVDEYAFADGKRVNSVRRFGWKLIELYEDETRVFPFVTSRKDGSFLRIWPFYESEADKSSPVKRARFLALNPIRHTPQIDRNWSKFWTFYERETNPVCTHHSLFWGIFRWRTVR